MKTWLLVYSRATAAIYQQEKMFFLPYTKNIVLYVSLFLYIHLLILFKTMAFNENDLRRILCRNKFIAKAMNRNQKILHGKHIQTLESRLHQDKNN